MKIYWLIVLSVVCFLGYIFLYIHPQRVIVETEDIGIVKGNSSCYQKLIVAGVYKNTYEAVCRTVVEWNGGKEEIVELPFPAIKGERVAKYKITVCPYLLPSRKHYEYRSQ